MTGRPAPRPLFAPLLAGLVLGGCGGSGGSGTPGVDGDFHASGTNDEACPATAADFASDTTIPEGASCRYENIDTSAGIRVGRGATFELVQGELGGNVQADGAESVVLDSAIVRGNLQLDGGGGVTVVDSIVRGDIQLEGNEASIRVSGTEVAGNITLHDNSGGVAVDENELGGNLQCEGNQPEPTGGGNVANGQLSGQCAEL